MDGNTKGPSQMLITTLFKKDGKRSRHQIAWKHTFVSLAYRDQNRIPTTELEKDELYEAGLGTKVIEFSSVNMNAEVFHDVLMRSYPKLREGENFNTKRMRHHISQFIIDTKI